MLFSLTAGALADLTVGEMLSGLFTTAQLQGTTLWEIAVNIPEFTIGELVASVPGFAGLTIEDLLDYLTLLYTGGTNPFVVSDILALLLSPQSTGWETLDLGASRPQSLPGVEGGVADYVAQIRLEPTPGAASATTATVLVRMDLPAEFAYVEGSSKVGGAVVTDPEVLDAPSTRHADPSRVAAAPARRAAGG